MGLFSSRNTSAATNNQPSSSLLHTTRTGIKVAGVFVLVGAGAAVVLNTDGTQANQTPSQHSSEVTLTHTAASTPVSSPAIDNQTTTDTKGAGSSSSTTVTVNGQNIPVPENGSSQQTLSTPDGNVTVNVSSNSTGTNTSVTGTASSTSITSTQIHTDNSSSSSSLSVHTQTGGS